MMELLALVLGLSTAVERIVEYFIGWVFDLERFKPYAKAQRYIAGGLGLYIAYYIKLDLVSMLGGPDAGNVGILLMGLAIGGGTELVHSVLSGFGGKR